MRKLLSVLLVLAMVLGLASTAFAANDVTGTKYDAAVTRLNALSILKGYTDGSFKPTNSITRAEFAAVAVRALGLEDAAKNTFGATQFKDVPASHWAAGYINVAVGRGIIKGYPDSTFKPEANVTNAEAMAMLVRVLGYDPSVTGTWPMNYVSKAAEIGLTSGLTLGTDQPAIRGDVAMMTDNALTIHLMVQSTFGTFQGYTVTADTLLANKLQVTELTGKIVEATPLLDRVNLKANEVMLSGNKYTFVSGINMEALAGHKVDAWAKDGEIFYVLDKTAASKIVTFTVKSATATTIVDDGATTDAGDDITYTVNGTEKVFYNHVETNMVTADPNLDGATVTLVLDSTNKVQFVNALEYNDGNYIVTKVDPTAVSFKRVSTAGAETNLVLKDAKYTIVDATGAVKTIADVAKNDVVSIALTSGQYWIRDVRNSVNGTVTKVTSTDDSALSNFRVYVGTTAYKLATGAQTRDTAYAAITTGNVDTLVGTTGTFYLDAAGKIFVADTSAAEVETNLAFLDTNAWAVPSADGTTMYVKILKLDGTKVTMPTDLSTSDLALVDEATEIGDLFEYHVADGVIDDITAVTPDAVGVTTASADYDRVTVDGDTYVVTADTKIYSQIGAAGTKPTAITLSVVRGGAGMSGLVVANPDFPARADVVIITAGTLSAAPATPVLFKYTYVVDTTSGDVRHMVVDEKGTEKDYVVASGAATTAVIALDANDLVVPTFDGSGKVATVPALTTLSVTGHTLVTGELDATGGIVMVGGNSYFTTSKTIVYDATGDDTIKVDWSTVTVGCEIDLYQSSNNISVIVITDK